MVDTLHAAGIEVILDVVYNHTAEGGTDLPIWLSYRGIDPGAYYLPGDITGTGNSLQTRSLATVRLVCDSLRYFAERTAGGRIPVRPGVGAGPARVADRSTPSRRCCRRSRRTRCWPPAS